MIFGSFILTAFVVGLIITAALGALCILSAVAADKIAQKLGGKR